MKVEVDCYCRIFYFEIGFYKQSTGDDIIMMKPSSIIISCSHKSTSLNSKRNTSIKQPTFSPEAFFSLMGFGKHTNQNMKRSTQS